MASSSPASHAAASRATISSDAGLSTSAMTRSQPVALALEIRPVTGRNAFELGELGFQDTGFQSGDNCVVIVP
jgi:hypothetical protein